MAAKILRAIEAQPGIDNKGLAAQLNLSYGTVCRYTERILGRKGYIKVLNHATGAVSVKWTVDPEALNLDKQMDRLAPAILKEFAAKLGPLGGKKRAANLPAKRRSAIAKEAAAAHWSAK
jgi:hypothetical protein